VSVDVVQAHLAAAWSSDWDTLRRSLADKPQLLIRSGERTHSELEIGGLYRFISQAWDFQPGTVQLSDKGDGVVEAQMCLTNGGGWVKKVAGRYHVVGNLIDVVDLTDTFAVEGSC
jgi:hypothetical protein